MTTEDREPGHAPGEQHRRMAVRDDRRSTFQLARGDAVAWLRALPPSSVDLVITDPPYESLEKHRAVGTTTRLKHSKASSNDWFSIFPNERFPELFAEIYRVLAKDRHFYLFCDPETMFVAKPLAEAAGFKFWKPLIWDKCLGPDTLVWTTRGAVRIAEVTTEDRVALPEGGTSAVRAVRATSAPAVRIVLSDGTDLVASRDHRLLRADGAMVEAGRLLVGDALCTRDVRERAIGTLRMDEVIPDEIAIHELPDSKRCLWCDVAFADARAASAHQARWCEAARSKQAMANELGYLQNDSEICYPREVPLDYELGKVVGLFAAEGVSSERGITFSLHADEKHLHSLIARVARSLGVRAYVRVDGNTAVVHVDFQIMRHLIRYFVGGSCAVTKYLKPTVYAAPSEFRRGVLAGLLEGDGHWSHEEQRETYVSASPDLAMFARRELSVMGRAPTIHRFENEHAGGWKVRFDPANIARPVTVTAIEDLGSRELVDVSIADRDELFLLANGVVTHNCSIGMGYHYRARYECILFFEKGKRKLADLGVADIIEAKRIVNGYPAEKPSDVSDVLVAQSSVPGELVIDPFLGSGSVGVAALRNGRDFAGNDLCAEAVEIARERLVAAGGRDVARAPRDAPVPQLGLTL
jgi:DNA modification methylase